MPWIQLKLMAGMATVVLVTVLVSGYFAEQGLRAQALAELEHSLAARAALAVELVAELPLQRARSDELEERARRAARAAGARVTLMALDGSVVADSEIAASDLGRVENHASRPEMRAALAGGTGTSTRTSTTIGRSLLYLAVPAGDPMRGVVRLAVDLPDVEAAVGDLRREIAMAGALGLAAALLLSFPLSWLSLRSFAEMRQVLEALAAGDLGRRLRWHMRDERREIAAAVNAMAEQLEARVGELTAEKEQLRAVLDGMVEGVLVIGAEGRVLLANRALRELLDAWGEVEGRLPLEVIRNAEIDAVLTEARNSDQPIARELEIAPAEKSVEVHAVPLRAGSGTTGVVAVFHDTTELHRLEAMRRDFVANASHELKTPVTAIRGFAELLTTHDLAEPERRKQLNVIQQHANRLAQLVEDLLELSRIESGRMHPEFEDLDLAQIARRLCEDLAPMFAEREVAVELVGGNTGKARADRRSVEQVLRNLLDNAAKYTDPGGRVEIRIGPANGMVRVDIEDTGIGIPEELQTRIFERFYRVDAARSRALGGTGLGLAIVKHLVQSCGGDVFVASEPGRGSTFSVTFRRA